MGLIFFLPFEKLHSLAMKKKKIAAALTVKVVNAYTYIILHAILMVETFFLRHGRVPCTFCLFDSFQNLFHSSKSKQNQSLQMK